jgi:YihY family inner membrane protein
MQTDQDPFQDFIHTARKIISIFQCAINTFNERRAAQAAAGIAYYAFFSIFPLILMLVFIGTFFVRGEEAIQTVIEIVGQVFPVSAQLLSRNIQRVLELRTSFTVIGLVTLLWSAAGVFSALAYNINLAWRKIAPRNFLQKRLAGLAMVGILALLYAAFLLVTLLVRSLPAVLAFLEGTQVADIGALKQIIQTIAGWTIVYFLYLGMYRWVPAVHVYWTPAMISAAAATIMWQAVTHAFVWFLRTGFSRYELVYGTLGTVVALLFLIYLNAWIVLFSAHLCAAIMDDGQH